MNKRIPFLFTLYTSLFIFSCNPEDPEAPAGRLDEVVKQAIFTSMQDFYFWESELPASLDVSQFSSNQEVLEALRFRPLDRWSYITTRAEFEASFTGQASGVHGFGIGLGQGERLYVTFVYDEGPAGQDGWERGWEIIGVNGRPISSYRNANGGYSLDLGPNEVGVTNTFAFRLPDGSETTRTIQKSAFQTNSVVYQDVIEQEGKKVGYWVYRSFKASQNISPTRSLEVDDSFEFFQAEGIDELIIDLRYNGGGSVAVAEQIMNYLVPSSANGNVMYTNRHNQKRSNFDRTVNFAKKGNLNLDRVIFITARGTASASELVINSLNPYMEVVLIGDNTLGKPVGAFPLSTFNRTLSANDVELVPITFATANVENSADFFDGFSPNFTVNDDPTRNWGDTQELRFNAALEFIRSGNIGARLITTFKKSTWDMIDNFEGLQKEFPMY